MDVLAVASATAGSSPCWVFAPPEHRDAVAAALGDAGDVPEGLVRFSIRGATAADVVAAIVGRRPGDASESIDVRDPREPPDAPPSVPPPGDVFDAASRAALRDAAAARTDAVVNAERHAAPDARAAPLAIPCLIVPRPAPRGAGGFDIVAPPGWGRPLWHALVRRGGHAAGRRERALVDAVAGGCDAAAYARPRWNLPSRTTPSSYPRRSVSARDRRLNFALPRYLAEHGAGRVRRKGKER